MGPWSIEEERFSNRLADWSTRLASFRTNDRLRSEAKHIRLIESSEHFVFLTNFFGQKNASCFELWMEKLRVQILIIKNYEKWSIFESGNCFRIHLFFMDGLLM